MDSAFDAWWSQHPLKNAKVTADDVFAAWKAARRAECNLCGKIAAEYGGRDADKIAELILSRNFGPAVRSTAK